MPLRLSLQEMRHPNIILFMGVVLEPAAVVTGGRGAGLCWLVGAASAHSTADLPAGPPAHCLPC